MKEVVTLEEARARGLKRYFTGVPCVRGHVDERCVAKQRCFACAREQTAKWRVENPEKRRAMDARRDPERLRQEAKIYYYEHLETQRAKARERGRARYRADPERAMAEVVAYRARNLDKVNERLRKWSKEKRADPQFRMRSNLRTRIAKVLRREQKAGSAIADLGCSVHVLMAHLETAFKPGMSWDNYGTVWHIDHIQPLTAFDLMDREQFLTACHYTNLQPMFGSENIRKGGVRRSKVPQPKAIGG